MIGDRAAEISRSEIPLTMAMRLALAVCAMIAVAFAAGEDNNPVESLDAGEIAAIDDGNFVDVFDDEGDTPTCSMCGCHAQALATTLCLCCIRCLDVLNPSACRLTLLWCLQARTQSMFSTTSITWGQRM